jgi:hypothetical protein
VSALLCLFLVLAASGLSARMVADLCRARRQPEPPATVAGALKRIAAQGVRLHVVPCQRDGDVAMGAYLSTRERPWEELAGLRREPNAPGWSGVVLLECSSPERVETMLPQWGERCCIVGEVLVYGDPKLVRRIAAALQADP